MPETTLSPLFTWRTAIASSVGPSDHALLIEAKDGGEPSSRNVSGLVQRAIAHVLATHMNERGGSCFPSMETIATEACCSERVAQYAIRALEESGWLIVRQGGSTRGNRRTSNTYRASFPAGIVEVLEEDGGRVNVVHLSEGRRVNVDTSTGERDAPERDINVTKTSAPTASKTADGIDLDKVYRWLDVQGVEYAVDRVAFEGELMQRFGIEAGSELAESLLREARAKVGADNPAQDGEPSA